MALIIVTVDKLLTEATQRKSLSWLRVSGESFMAGEGTVAGKNGNRNT